MTETDRMAEEMLRGEMLRRQAEETRRQNEEMIRLQQEMQRQEMLRRQQQRFMDDMMHMP